MAINLDIFLEGYAKLSSFLDNIWKIDKLNSLETRYIERMTLPIEMVNPIENYYTRIKLKDYDVYTNNLKHIYQIIFGDPVRVLRILEVDTGKLYSETIPFINNASYFGSSGVNTSYSIIVDTKLLNLDFEKENSIWYHKFLTECMDAIKVLTTNDTAYITKSLISFMLGSVLYNRLLGLKYNNMIDIDKISYYFDCDEESYNIMSSKIGELYNILFTGSIDGSLISNNGLNTVRNVSNILNTISQEIYLIKIKNKEKSKNVSYI